MTVTLAADLEARAAHMADVRREYELTKADHALEDGCDDCTRGIDPDRITGWGFRAGLLLCPPCLFEAHRYAAQMAARPDRGGMCHNGLHEMTPENSRHGLNSHGRPIVRCRECDRERVRAYRRRQRALDKAGDA